MHHTAATSLATRGAQGIIVGCTELPLLMPMAAYPLPAFDLPRLHAKAALDRALPRQAPLCPFPQAAPANSDLAMPWGGHA